MKLSRLLIIAITVLTFLAGCDQFEKKATDPQADKDIEAAYKARDYQKIIDLADSFQQSGAMADVKAYYWQGYARDRMQRHLSAEYFWGRAIKAAEESKDHRLLTPIAAPNNPVKIAPTKVPIFKTLSVLLLKFFIFNILSVRQYLS